MQHSPSTTSKIRTRSAAQFTFDDDTDDGATLEIVGVIGDMKSGDAREKPEPAVYRPILQIQERGRLLSHDSHAHDR